jgi:acyl-CoA thioesterase-1
MIPTDRPRRLLARVALGGILAWCASSEGAPPESAPGPTTGRPPPESGSRVARDGPALTPNPLVSRAKRVAGWSSLPFAEPRKANDGDYSSSWNAGRPTPDRPAWVAIDVGAGPRRLLLNWSAAGSFNYQETDYGSPGAYRIETSGDSTDGTNGSWRTAQEVLAVSVHGQANTFDFTGQRWVKFVVTRTPAESPNGVQISEIDVHDVTAGARDSWFFLGDSITAFAFERAPAHQPSFAAWVHERHAEYFPAMINGGTGGDKSDEGAAHIGDWLARNPDLHFWAIAYGTNDAAGNTSETTRFRANMQAIVDKIRESGRVPILATIPFASDGQHGSIPKFNRVLEEIRTADSLPGGPDLYAWFVAHPDELRDGVHPNDRGIVSINRLWGEAVDALYSR